MWHHGVIDGHKEDSQVYILATNQEAAWPDGFPVRLRCRCPGATKLLVVRQALILRRELNDPMICRP